MSNEYKPTIGLEIHAELKTQTKMFCNSLNDTNEERPNFNICPICMGHPGTLPVINKEAVKSVLKVGVAVSGEIADYTEFDRKNYFYPDIPKGYQISQYKYPLIKGGEISGVSITRIHLEEDTAKSSHEEGDFSLVDFNRAGVPLMELVTEPVISSAKQAASFGRELQLLLQYLGVSDANMEKGEMRVEANISISKDNNFGTKVEVKNLNSFKAVEDAINYEIKRHEEVLERGELIVQETRGWDEKKKQTFSQRTKEDSHDYRYFPDPDLPKLVLSEIPEFSKDSLLKEIPELPWERRAKYVERFNIKAEDAEMYVRNSDWAKYFEEVSAYFNNENSKIVKASNYITSDLWGLVNSSSLEDKSPYKVKPEDFAELINMLSDGTLSSRGGKDVLKAVFENGGNPKDVALKMDLIQKNDTTELSNIVKDIIAKNTEVVSDYKKGKEAALQYLVGQGMKATKGSANPELIKKILLEFLV